MNIARNPELQRLLASLNGVEYSEPAATSNNQHNPKAELPIENPYGFQSNPATHVPVIHDAANLPGLGFAPVGDSTKPITPLQKATDPRARIPAKDPLLSAPQAENIRSRPTTPLLQDIPDSSEIITWPAGLRHVTKYLVPNEKIASRIKHLISEQHKHERQWWAQREAIIARHEGRSGNQAKAAELLKSLGGVSVPVAKADPESDRAELEAFDRKVHKSLTQMVADFDGQLRKMGVPFFAIKHDLVMLEDGSAKQATTKGRLDKGELRELQRKMLETLEDLFGEDDRNG